MARLKIGIFASIQKLLPYLGKILFGTDSSDGKIYKYDGTTFTSVENPTPDFTSWTTLTSTFGSTNINSISYGNNTWVAVGNNGQIRTSTDATSWTTITSNFGSQNINDITYLNNTWVAVGNAGQIRTSTDSITWTTRTSNFGSSNINSIDYSNIFIAVGNAGQIRYSNDSIDWVTATSNFGTTNINGIKFANNRWVAVGASGQIRTSNNVIDWVTSTSGATASFSEVEYGNGLWIAAGRTANSSRRSTDAVTWTTVSVPIDNESLESIKYANNIWMVGDTIGRISTSTNGITWNTGISNFAATIIRAMTNENNIWLIGGGGGNLRKNALNNSVNQVNKYPYSGVLTNSIETIQAVGNDRGNDITYNNGIWVKANNSAIYRSTDGITWTTAQTGLQFLAIASNDNYYVVTQGASNDTPTIYYSTDSVTWSSNVLNTGETGQARSIKYRDGKFITTFGTAVYYNTIPPLAGPFSTTITSTRDIEYANGTWCAVGADGGGSAQVRTSTDLVTWVTRTPNASGTINSIAYNNNIWVFATSLGEVRYSTNAITWVTSFTASGSFNRVVTGENGFLLVGGSNRFFASRNGATWTTLSSTLASNANLMSAVFVDNKWQIISDNAGSVWGYGIMPNDIYLSPLDHGYIKYSGNSGENWITTNINETIDLKDIDSISYTTTTSAPSWTTRSALSGYISANSMKHLNGYHVAVGFYDDEYSVLDDRLRLFYSTNGISWNATNPNGATAGALRDISYGQGVWVLVGTSGLIRTTRDVTTNSVWTTRAAGFTTNLESIDYGDGIWIIAAPPSPTNVILRSVDAVSWTSHVSNLGTTSIVIKYGQNLWALGGRDGALATSTNGISWTTRTSNFGASRINTIEYGNNLWVAGGESGQIRTSTNAITWTTRTSNFGNTWIESIRYGNGVWKAVGRTGQVRTSTDAVTWTTETSNGGTFDIFAVAYGNNRWVYANQSGSPLSGTPYTLEDYSSYENFSIASNTGNVFTSTNLISWVSNNINLGGAFDGGKSLSSLLNTSGSISDIHSINSHPNLSTAIVKDNGLVLVKRSRDNIFDSIYNAGNNDALYTTWTSVISNFAAGKGGPSAITYGNGVWAAVGTEGNIRTSTDFITWTTRTSNFGTSTIKDIDFGAGLLVAVGNTGQIRTSTDGTTWTTRTSNFGTTNIESVIYGNSGWVAGGSTNQIRRSTDAITWVTSTSNITGNILDVNYGNNLYIAIASAAGLPVMRTSTDTISWNTVTSNFGITLINSVSYGDGLWIAVGNTGQIRTSTNGTTWNTVVSNATTQAFKNIVNVNGVYLAYEDNLDTFISANGISWATWSGNTGGNIFVTYENDRAISASEDRLFYAIPTPATPKAIITDLDDNGSEFLAVASNKAYRTTDFNTLTELNLLWTTRDSSFATTFMNTVTYGDNIWIAAGAAGTLYKSTDGAFWTSLTSNFGNTNILSIAHGNGLWVAVGSGGRMITSTDSTTWTSITSNFGTTNILSIAYGNNLWIAAGSTGQIRTSTNGATWTTRTSNFGNTQINEIKYGNGSWVAVGQTGQIRTSADGTTWTTRTSNLGSNDINGVSFGNNLFIAYTNISGIRTSIDGTTWTTRTIGISSIQDIEYDSTNNYWLAIGGGNYTSTNGITWTTKNNLSTSGSLALGNNTWVRVHSRDLFNSPSSLFNTSYSINTVNNQTFADAAGYLYQYTTDATYSSPFARYEITNTGLENISDVAYDATNNRYVIKSNRGLFESGQGFTVPANSIGGNWPAQTINGYRQLTPSFEADITDFEA